MRKIEEIEKWQVKRDCIINEYFKDAIEEDYLRKKYCIENCGKRCLKGEDYKKIKGGKKSEGNKRESNS